MIKHELTLNNGDRANLSLAKPDTYSSEALSDHGFRKFKTNNHTLRGVVRVEVTSAAGVNRVNFCLSPIFSFCGAVFVDYPVLWEVSKEEAHNIIKEVVAWLKFSSFFHITYNDFGIKEKMKPLVGIYNNTTSNTVTLYQTVVVDYDDFEDDDDDYSNEEDDE